MKKLIGVAIASAIAFTPLPASAHWRGPPAPIVGGIIGGIIGAIAGAHAFVPPPYGYTPPPAPALPAPPQDVQPPSQVDPDLTFVQHALNQLSGAGLVEDGIGGPATKQALLAYLQNQLALQGRAQ